MWNWLNKSQLHWQYSVNWLHIAFRNFDFRRWSQRAAKNEDDQSRNLSPSPSVTAWPGRPASLSHAHDNRRKLEKWNWKMIYAPALWNLRPRWGGGGGEGRLTQTVTLVVWKGDMVTWEPLSTLLKRGGVSIFQNYCIWFLLPMSQSS